MNKQAIERLIDNSVILINKPPGLTSHEVTTLVKKITGAKRAGHAGTLDPEVSGVLPVALGRATKLLQYIAGKDKTYIGIMKFKIPKTESEVESLFRSFTGELIQTPPKISAVRKVPRKRTVYALKLFELDPAGRLVLFETKVDAGTYIRTLCEDMGKGCGGARMEELRRTAVGKINERNTVTMQDLADAVWLCRTKHNDSLLRSMLREPQTLMGMPVVKIKESAMDSVYSGAQVMIPALDRVYGGPKKGDRVAIYCGERFIGVGILTVSEKDLEIKKKGIAVTLERIHKSE